MTNINQPFVTFELLNLETCRADPQWCRKEITKRLMLLLLEYTRSKPLPFMAHIEPFGPGPTRPPVQPAPSGEIYTIRSNPTDSWIFNDDAVWLTARNALEGTWMLPDQQQQTACASAYLSVGLFRIFRSWHDFDLSSIPASKTVLSVTLTLYIILSQGINTVFLEGTQTIPMVLGDFDEFGSTPFANVPLPTGSQTITFNAAGIAYIKSQLGSTAKIAARQYDNDYTGVEPTGADANKTGWRFAEYPVEADRPILTITTD